MKVLNKVYAIQKVLETLAQDIYWEEDKLKELKERGSCNEDIIEIVTEKIRIMDNFIKQIEDGMEGI